MGTQEDAGRGSSADVSSLVDVDVGRLKTRVPFDAVEIDKLLSTVPLHLLRWPELEQQLGKEAFKCWYDVADKNKKKYLATYPNACGSTDSYQELSSQIPERKEAIDYESAAFDDVCDSIPDVIRAYSQAHLEDSEMGCDVTKEAAQLSKIEYKRLNDLIKNFGTPPPRLEDANFLLDSNDESPSSKMLEDAVKSDAEWAEFCVEVQREVDVVKSLCQNEQYTPVERKPLTWLDQFIGALEKETGVPFEPGFAEHMADLAAGKDSDISVQSHARSLDVKILPESDSDDDLRALRRVGVTNRPKKTAPIKKKPERRDTATSDVPDVEKPPPEEPFNLEQELQRYVALKTRLVLSRVHDEGNIKWKKDNNKDKEPSSKIYIEHYNREIEEWYFGPKEFIVLKDEGGKKIRTDIVVGQNEDLIDKIAFMGTPSKKFRLMSSSEGDGNHFFKLLLTPRYLKKLGIQPDIRDDSPPHQEPISEFEPECSAVQVRCEVLDATDREKRLQRRKMFRWERFKFRPVQQIETETEFSDAAGKLKVSAECQPEKSPQAPITTNAANSLEFKRRQIADSLFQDDSRKFVEYVDFSEMASSEILRPMPVITSGSLSRGYIPEVLSSQKSSTSTNDGSLPKQSTDIASSRLCEVRRQVTAASAPTKAAGEAADRPAVASSGLAASAAASDPPAVASKEAATAAAAAPPPPPPDEAANSAVTSTHHPTPVDSSVPKNDKITAKKDKKKKKRRSSSSSDDLEMLEKKSEARLGLRK